LKFNVKEAQLAWERRHPVWGERVLMLQDELYDCESERRTKSGRIARDIYTQTAKNLRLMLAAEGAEA
jgi:hypothetical protein